MADWSGRHAPDGRQRADRVGRLQPTRSGGCRLWFASDRQVERVVEGRFDRGEQVAVGVEGDGDGAVTEAFHDRSRVCSFGDQQRSIAVAQIMKSGSLRQTSADDGRLEMPLEPVAVAERPVLWAAPHARLLVDPLNEFSQLFDHRLRDRN